MSVVHVKKAAEKADQMIEELRASQNPESEPVEQEQEETTEEEAQLAEVDQGTAEETGQAPVEPEEGDWQAQARLWEQRYRSLNGMIQSRDRQIQQLHELLAGMQQTQQTSSTQSVQQPSEEPSKGYITKEDEDSYGADLVDMARRAGREESQQMINALRAELADMKASLQNVSQVSRITVQERFERQLDGLTKGRYKEIDADPAFIEWLEKSPARHRVFAEGVQGRDASTVAEFFNEYARMAEVEQARAERPAQARANRLERQVAPGKSKAGAAPVGQTGEAKTWTRTEIAQLYANKRKYAADEFSKLEREVAAAQREGRVDFNR